MFCRPRYYGTSRGASECTKRIAVILLRSRYARYRRGRRPRRWLTSCDVEVSWRVRRRRERPGRAAYSNSSSTSPLPTPLSKSRRGDDVIIIFVSDGLSVLNVCTYDVVWFEPRRARGREATFRRVLGTLPKKRFENLRFQRVRRKLFDRKRPYFQRSVIAYAFQSSIEMIFLNFLRCKTMVVLAKSTTYVILPFCARYAISYQQVKNFKRRRVTAPRHGVRCSKIFEPRETLIFLP